MCYHHDHVGINTTHIFGDAWPMWSDILAMFSNLSSVIEFVTTHLSNIYKYVLNTSILLILFIYDNFVDLICTINLSTFEAQFCIYISAFTIYHITSVIICIINAAQCCIYVLPCVLVYHVYRTIHMLHLIQYMILTKYSTDIT